MNKKVMFFIHWRLQGQKYFTTNKFHTKISNGELFPNYGIGETGSRVGHFTGIYHHHLVTTSAHMDVYHYLLLKSGMKSSRDIELMNEYRT